ncbi:MAG TPA: hypothetical protein VMV46_11735 [Thermoanaerobaculia bacterium]|nr:hypothetical protein [Thermoanaerobaculia bacterium]
MSEPPSLSVRLRGARRTGLAATASRNRLFAGRALFCVAGACLVAAVGALVDRLGVLPAREPTLALAVVAAALGLIVGAWEAAGGGARREAWAVIGLDALALVAALAFLF